MSLVGTLGKVAVGVMLAKGVSSAMGGGAGGGLGGILGKAAGAAGGGGLGGLLGGAMGGQGGGAGGLGSLLGGGNTAGAAGGLGALLGGQQQQGQQPSAGGGLGGLLDSLGGGAGGAAAGAGAAGGLGGLLNSALAGQPEPEPPTQQQEETAKILIQAMVNAAKSDGQIDEAEQQKIVANLGNEVSETERNFVLSEMQSPLDADAFIASVPSGAEQQVYLMSLMAIDLDTQAEAQYLDKLRQAFGMSEQDSNAIHAHLGVPPLYG